MFLLFLFSRTQSASLQFSSCMFYVIDTENILRHTVVSNVNSLPLECMFICFNMLKFLMCSSRIKCLYFFLSEIQFYSPLPTVAPVYLLASSYFLSLDTWHTCRVKTYQR